MDVARYSHQIRVEAKMAANSTRDDLPRFQPVTFTLIKDNADRYDDLMAQAAREHSRRYFEVKDEADRRFPEDHQAEQRLFWFHAELAQRRIPPDFYKITGGIIARMAINAWARRAVDKVVLDAVDYAQRIHLDPEQPPRRARRDMQDIGREK
ncbi:hypothetical protein ACFQHO_53895 [Actinomadura yumaensis]